ncbi:metallophosphatase domain-containing protein [Candidatus Protochlamydia phocaeensis]|uniref:metallophosphatase domain-containing protein n=1 Tax=Candidatus Protochlamydia phocaeensis TaxID=1414722 RepID=UPI00083855DE|nr:metallophosphatase domain-containing protein [Candidatus Protochlamydia phocaeensis]
MLIDCLSDLHGFKPELPGGDLLIVCGDLTRENKRVEYDQFTLWLSQLPYRCKVVIGGNHDGLLERKQATIGNGNIHYLCDSGLEFEGLKIWGSPYTPTFGHWYFMKNRGQDIRKHWDLIPSDTDVLVTHGPPYSILDEIDEHVHVGCKDLRAVVLERVRPRIHSFGHIHEEGGKMIGINDTLFVNCSYVDERYQPVHAAIRLVIE